MINHYKEYPIKKIILEPGQHIIYTNLTTNDVAIQNGIIQLKEPVLEIKGYECQDLTTLKVRIHANKTATLECNCSYVNNTYVAIDAKNIAKFDIPIKEEEIDQIKNSTKYKNRVRKAN